MDALQAAVFRARFVPKDVPKIIVDIKVGDEIKALSEKLELLERQLKALTATLSSPQRIEYTETVSSITSGRPTIKRIVHCVSEFYKISPTDLLSYRRAKNVVGPRQVAMYLARKLTLHGLPSIGKAFGRDHSTIIWGVAQIERKMANDGRTATDIAMLEAMLEPLK